MDTISLLATLPAVIALVTLGKALGISGKWSMLLAVILGVVLSVLDYKFAGSGVYKSATTGLLLGLAAAGVYDIAKTIVVPPVAPRAPPEALPAPPE